MEEETGEDTIQAAHKTRQHQGYHEAEVTFGGEADLHKHYRGCKKNPGHSQFTPIGDFKIEHLPPDYRDILVLNLIRVEADLTCRLSVKYTSESRPKVHPEHPHLFYSFYQDRGYDWMRVGTGWVNHVYIYKEKDGKNCICEECRQPGTQTPKKEWGKVTIRTACHVVFDSDEARHTTCHLFYDEGSTHISQCPSLTGLSVMSADIKKDSCWMKCVTHDMDLADKLYGMLKRRNLRWHKVYKTYKLNKNVSCDSDPISRLTVIISHPHGLSKQVTVGKWTQRQILSPPRHKSRYGYGHVDTSYSYNTATCPGSSGAKVITLLEDRWSLAYSCYSHHHSEGGEGNNNKSGVQAEFLPSSSVFSIIFIREDENDDFSNTVSSGLDPALSVLRPLRTCLDTRDGVSDDEVERNLSGKGRNVSESEDETPPKERNQEPKGEVSKGEDSTETSTGGRTSNEADDSKSMGAATATGKATTSSGASKRKGKALKSRKQKKKKILMSDSDLDDGGDDVDHHKNDGYDGDIDNDDIDQDDEGKEDDKSRDLSDDVQQYVKESNDVTCFNPTGNQAD